MMICKERTEEKIVRAAEVYEDVYGKKVSAECVARGHRTTTAFPDFATPPTVMFSSDYELTFFWLAGEGLENSHSVEIDIYPNGYWVRAKQGTEILELNGDDTPELPLDKIYELLIMFTAYVESTVQI